MANHEYVINWTSLAHNDRIIECRISLTPVRHGLNASGKGPWGDRPMEIVQSSFSQSGALVFSRSLR